uniref:Immunoglobulin V-set domain-containing protein n=1 Tax=Salarias fasciatus TaxID=181472 RepID=A0A672JNX4_SALFA
MFKLSSIFISCFTVQSSVPPVFVQKGKDVLLDVDNVPEDFFLFVWKFEKENSILVTFFHYHDSEILPAYTGRIDIPDNKKYSVILKNLQETDSRVYSGRLTTDDGDSTLVQHNIIVQDVASPVQLEVNSVSNSSHSCNVTLTCSTADSHISSTFRCIDQKCDQDGGNQSKITNSSSSLQVYLHIQLFCFFTGSHIVSDGISFCRVKTVVFSAGLFLMVSALISVHLFLKVKKHHILTQVKPLPQERATNAPRPITVRASGLF